MISQWLKRRRSGNVSPGPTWQQQQTWPVDRSRDGWHFQASHPVATDLDFESVRGQINSSLEALDLGHAAHRDAEPAWTRGAHSAPVHAVHEDYHYSYDEEDDLDPPAP
eukprot:CAMPEP_0113688968 /NCGR_PEP_ID=MMETSP0038_2-20120614/16861_1 /TAXON_ID=2898 /ORGANISM="Cryptomonas paramecium" /LENGTH=108 /DNA_ID=CAMNT_0000609903 /DNA_START=184 /DNA_END=506 /DNA_ORIENTATION=- /assembly_acc=CAM_ASM_000170